MDKQTIVDEAIRHYLYHLEYRKGNIKEQIKKYGTDYRPDNRGRPSRTLGERLADIQEKQRLLK